ncbi:MAG: Uma2 family endonuclease [Myxococcales bacterium]|nr:Uma2 family endonuclease [Myxococcales bacterium]
MSVEERARVVASLPSEWEDALPPEGDPHWLPKVNTRKTLERYFDRLGRSVYVGSELAVYYPNERVFAPDVFAVLDVPTHQRLRWVVDDEQRGLDWVLEIFVSGDRRKDHIRNVELFARLGIKEYFLLDWGRLRLNGWRLSETAVGTYQQLVPQRGRFTSGVLGLELGVVEERLRFFHLDAELPEAEELIRKLERAVDGLQARAEEESRRAEEESRRAEEESRRAEEESRRAEEESRRADTEAARRAEAEQRLADALAELERIKRGR